VTKELIIYCDESETRGCYFSNFYGGALVRSIDIDNIKVELEQIKSALNFHGEVKWSKVTANYADKYISLMEVFFNLIAQDKIKMRVMFT